MSNDTIIYLGMMADYFLGIITGWIIWGVFL